MEDLRVKMIWVAMALLKSENFISFENFCFDKRFWFISFLMGIWGLVCRSTIWVFLLHMLMCVDFKVCFLCIWVTLIYVNVGICLSHAKCLINCLYEVISWIHNCYHVLKHVALRLIKSESFWHRIKIIIILLWNCKSVLDKFKSAAIHDF